MANPRFPEIYVQLTDEDGNVFSIIGKVSGALRSAGHSLEASIFIDKALDSPSYYDVLNLCTEFVDVG